jgi:hypothetical protein
MVTSQQCLKKYGQPSQTNPCMVLWDVPKELEIGLIPKRILCNKDMINPLSKAFKNLIDRGYVSELKTFDGCFNIRKKRGLKSMSLHSWAIAIDFNAFSNPLGLTRAQIIAKGLTPFSEDFLQCFRDAGFDCGADWKRRPDFMHFQLKSI